MTFNCGIFQGHVKEPPGGLSVDDVMEIQALILRNFPIPLIKKKTKHFRERGVFRGFSPPANKSKISHQTGKPENHRLKHKHAGW